MKKGKRSQDYACMLPIMGSMHWHVLAHLPGSNFATAAQRLPSSLWACAIYSPFSTGAPAWVGTYYAGVVTRAAEGFRLTFIITASSSLVKAAFLMSGDSWLYLQSVLPGLAGVAAGGRMHIT